MDVRITLSANAGIALQMGNVRIWVDALHEEKQNGFSTVTPSLQGKMLHHAAFFKPDVICYTHCHPDHFSEQLTMAATQIWPSATVIVPEKVKEGWITVAGDVWEYAIGDVTVKYFRLPHEGQQYADTVHYGILVEGYGRNIVFTGDCAICDPALVRALNGVAVGIAVVDFPWITLSRGRQYLENKLRAAHVVACHLPFAEDDVLGYRASAQRAIDAMAGDVRLMLEPLQNILL